MSTRLSLRSRSSREPAVPFDSTGPRSGLYINASGDFLLAPPASCTIPGFVEYSDTYIHLDSYTCYLLRAAGLERRFLTPPRTIQNGDLGSSINGPDRGLPGANVVAIVLQSAVSPPISREKTHTGCRTR